MARALRKLDRAHPFVMLAAALASVAIGNAWPAALVGVIAIGASVVAHRGVWTPSGGFGLANTLTALRLVLIAGLVPIGGQRPGPASSLLVIAIFVLDGMDGTIARRRAEASAFGALFDMECDALLVLVGSLVLFCSQRLGAFILVPGALRYLYAGLLQLLPQARGEVPRSRFNRYVFSIVVASMSASLWPLEPLQRPLAYVATLLLSYSFGRSFYWSFKSS